MKIISTGKKGKAGVVVGDYERTEPVVTISEDELHSRIKEHDIWLQGDMDMDQRVDFSNLDLSGTDLSDLNLTHAYLRGSVLTGAKLVNTNLTKADIANVDLSGAHLAGADLTEAFATNTNMDRVNFANFKSVDSEGINSTYIAHAKLIKARMSGAILSNTNLCRVDLTGAELERVNLTNSNLVSANLSKAIVQGSDLRGSNLLLADLTHTDFRNSLLDDVNLKSANLDNTDLRKTKGTYFVDDNSIRGTRFTTKGCDPYSVLRRTYTGPMFFLILCLTIIAFTPYALKALAWSYAGSVETKIDSLVTSKIKTLDNESASGIQDEIHSVARIINPANNKNFIKTRVLYVVAGFEESNPFLAVLITCILIVYNSVRGWITLKMGSIRDAEERSQHSPEKSEYIQLYLIHSRFMRWFMLAAFAVASWNILILLSTPVYVPN